MNKTTTFVVTFLFCVVSWPVFSEAIPLQKVAIRISQKTLSDNDNLLGSKTVMIDRAGDGYKATWYSIVKELDESGDYPTHKIKSKRGVITVDGLENKTSFLLPELWAQGYLRADLVLPLWIDPAYLKLKSRERRILNPGLVNNNANYLKQAPPEVFERLTFFQNLYDQVIVDEDLQPNVQLSKSDQKELKNFARNFFYAGIIAHTKASLIVNGNKKAYPSVIIGNDYFHMIVVDDPTSPLVIGFQIFSDKAPRLFQEVFKDFKRLFEFQVTQVTER